MDKVTLIVDVVTQEEVYRGNVLKAFPSDISAKVSESHEFLEGVEQNAVHEVLHIVDFHRVNPLGGTEDMYIAMNSRVEKLLKFPFNTMHEQNEKLKWQVEYQNKYVLKYQKLSNNWWERLKFLFTSKIVDELQGNFDGWSEDDIATIKRRLSSQGRL